ncbi:alpha-ketoglutarate-dependent dioxygenase AlkB [Lentibacter algarum]|uniref:alpha-ketoglutarate-dependent dioxygenase AlkB family protein n=1 Tax=Lentibacter algarum TaxID=576131 RepID=UPI001C06AF5D|nr:alpha-ketoglutarate-dependent dioxygenase AlkB [Lentibacter algarum]MBU2981059.1 alpha-ketoglutarate-dependent dioxygenase AlkB [Lentibacter algarum]
MNLEQKVNLGGADIYLEALGVESQLELVGDIREIARAAPLYSPETRFGKKMSVRLTSAGNCGWMSDRRGYRYEPKHPRGTDWPPIPQSLLDIWNAIAPDARQPDCALINFYGEGARMGLHQDNDEADYSQPVVSVSLGDDGLFRIGGTERGGKTVSHWLRSGEVLVLGGEARLAYHGVDRVKHGTSTLLPDGGRINITMRVVT